MVYRYEGEPTRSLSGNSLIDSVHSVFGTLRLPVSMDELRGRFSQIPTQYIDDPRRINRSVTRFIKESAREQQIIVRDGKFTTTSQILARITPFSQVIAYIHYNDFFDRVHGRVVHVIREEAGELVGHDARYNIAGFNDCLRYSLQLLEGKYNGWVIYTKPPFPPQ